MLSQALKAAHDFASGNGFLVFWICEWIFVFGVCGIVMLRRRRNEQP